MYPAIGNSDPSRLDSFPKLYDEYLDILARDISASRDESARFTRTTQRARAIFCAVKSGATRTDVCVARDSEPAALALGSACAFRVARRLESRAAD